MMRGRGALLGLVLLLAGACGESSDGPTQESREAPSLEQFARDHAAKVNVVGLGTQDSFGEAQSFVARHKVTFRMLWERGFRSWDHFGIQGQPASVLVSADGRELKRWIGALDADEHAEVLRLVSG